MAVLWLSFCYYHTCVCFHYLTESESHRSSQHNEVGKLTPHCIDSYPWATACGYKGVRVGEGGGGGGGARIPLLSF